MPQSRASCQRQPSDPFAWSTRIVVQFPLNQHNYANRRRDVPFKAQDVFVINGIPHGDRIFCGSTDLGLYARRVSKLKVRVDKAKERETVAWVEPPTYKWKGRRESIELAMEGEVGHWERNYLAPLSTDTW
jgi:hypothetical protein